MIRVNSKALGVLVGLVIAACVTVNVNFPESAVQKATDDFVRDLYKSKSKTEQTTDAPKTTWTLSFGTVAWADDVQFIVDTPKANVIKARMQANASEILKYKRLGMMGEAQSGLLVIRDKDKIKPLQLQVVEKLLATENRDREELYREFASANSANNVSMDTIKRAMFRSFKAKSPSGTPVEEEAGVWESKP